jgi:hypothetical protein
LDHRIQHPCKRWRDRWSRLNASLPRERQKIAPALPDQLTKALRREFPAWLTQDTPQDHQLIDLNPGTTHTRKTDNLRNGR